MAERIREFKRSLYVPKIPGVRSSPPSAQLTVSTGIPSIDSIIGGGLPLGSLTVIEEDQLGLHTNVILRYFLAEGLVFKHKLFLASKDEDPSRMLKQIPRCVSGKPVADDEYNPSSSNGTPGMKIAWRYESISPAGDSRQSEPSVASHDFDLSRPIGADTEASVESVKSWKGGEESSEIEHLLRCLDAELDDERLDVRKKRDDSNVIRVGVFGFGSPLWNWSNSDLSRLLWALKSRLRRHHAVAVVSLHSLCLDDAVKRDQLRQIADCVLRLESFAGREEEHNPVFRNYHGMFRLLKLPAVNALASYVPPSTDFAFRLRRRKFTVECFHLPPDLSETVSRVAKENSAGVRPQLGCVPGGSSKLDF